MGKCHRLPVIVILQISSLLRYRDSKQCTQKLEDAQPGTIVINLFVAIDAPVRLRQPFLASSKNNFGGARKSQIITS
jgi:hypothetical protein